MPEERATGTGSKPLGQRGTTQGNLQIFALRLYNTEKGIIFKGVQIYERIYRSKRHGSNASASLLQGSAPTLLVRWMDHET